MDGHQVQHPRRLLVCRARPSCTQDRPVGVDDFGLDKQVRERTVRGVGGELREHDLGVAG